MERLAEDLLAPAAVTDDRLRLLQWACLELCCFSMRSAHTATAPGRSTLFEIGPLMKLGNYGKAIGLLG
jgi:hypothetical protein